MEATCSSCINSFEMPSRPEAAIVCPALAFAPPTAIGPLALVPKAVTSDDVSVGSPSAVPVPCSSMQLKPAVSAVARVIMAAWAAPFGAVKLALRPSHRTAPPRSVNVGLAAPSSDVCNTVAHAPSELTYPSARWSRVKHRPFSESMPANAASSVCCSVSSRRTLVTAAASHSRACTMSAAFCKATRAEEHAVSTVWHGPCSPST